MKAIATLTFDLEDADARESHKDVLKATDYKFCLSEIDNFLRSKLKYEDHPEEIDKIYQQVRDELNQIMEGNGVSIWE